MSPSKIAKSSGLLPAQGVSQPHDMPGLSPMGDVHTMVLRVELADIDRARRRSSWPLIRGLDFDVGQADNARR
jgi:hypothetical protein